MEVRFGLNNRYAPSKEIVAREVGGEFIIIPIVAGIGDLEDEFFTLNETGRAIWDKLDGKRTLKEVAECLLREFEASPEEIEEDVLGLTEELLKRKMVVKMSGTGSERNE